MKPRWYFFAWFAVLAAVHLAAEGWTDTTAIGLPVGFAATLVLVFVPRLPWWATGEARTGVPIRRRVKLAVVGVLWVLVAAAIVAGLVDHPPRGADVLYAGVFVSLFAGASAYGLAKLLPRRRPSTRRALRWKLAFATVAVWAGGAFALAAEVAAVVVTGGWLPWVLPVPSLVAVLSLAVWRADLAVPVRCLASGSWTPVTAAAFDVRPGEPVDGWAVLPGDVRIRFHLSPVPADVAAELRDRRRLWLAGWPSEELVTGLPDGGSYAVGHIGRRVGGGKNTVTGPAGPR